MSAVELMQDALDQLRRNHGYTLAVTAPQGLFDAETYGSAFWNPSEYLSAFDPSCNVGLYRVVSHEGFAVGVSRDVPDFVPLSLRDTAQPSLSTNSMSFTMLCIHMALSYENEHSGHLSEENVARTVIKLLHRIMSHWGEDRTGAVEYVFETVWQGWYTKPFDVLNLRMQKAMELWFRRIDPIRPYMRFLCNHRTTKVFDEAYCQEFDSLINSCDIKHIHDVVYNVVAAALELDLEYCEKKKMKLIFSSMDNDERWPPRVGFCRGNVNIEDIASGRRKTITVAMGGLPSQRSTLLYEAIHIEDFVNSKGLRRSIYQVFAVWVPTKTIADDEYGAYARWKDEKPSRDVTTVLI